MQALILAAGMGKRLQKYTRNQTKCMIEVAGKTLLEHACDALKAAGIHKLILVAGYHGEELISYSKGHIDDMEIEYVTNKDFDSTNNIFSLYLARDYLKRDDTILLESDLIFDPAIINEMVASEKPNLAAVAEYEYWMDGTVCRLGENGNIEEFIDKSDFNYALTSQYYKTVNIYKFSKEFAEKRYIPFLETYIRVYGSDQYYESVLKIISHINRMDLQAFDVGKHKWYEIDNAQDYDIAETMFQKTDKRLAGYEYHFGGYWRFPGVKDFCYLVNPYFPSEQMINQLQFMFKSLLTQYPSGMRTQKINAGKYFNIDEECILVGNGAAELINVLGRISCGTIGVPRPSFNEYVRCFDNCDKVYINSRNNDFAIFYEDIENIAGEINTLVLVNPDNPSGYFIEKDEMLRIIDLCCERGIKCVIDESFIDFSDENHRYTLIDQMILNKYSNLVVIKSISKSYGVPGCRLGVLATSDKEYIEKIRKNMAIWNINSFGEYLLEIMPLYTKNYWDACNKLADERKWFTGELNKFDFFEVYSSQANYIMCRVKGFNSRELATKLLDHDFLIKDLSLKDGFDGEAYIRLAVKDRTENEALLNVLRYIND